MYYNVNIDEANSNRIVLLTATIKAINKLMHTLRQQKTPLYTVLHSQITEFFSARRDQMSLCNLWSPLVQSIDNVLLYIRT